MTEKWVQLVFGVWLIVSPWVLGVSGNTLMLWSNVLLGLVFILISLWNIFGRDADQSIVRNGDGKEEDKK